MRITFSSRGAERSAANSARGGLANGAGVAQMRRCPLAKAVPFSKLCVGYSDWQAIVLAFAVHGTLKIHQVIAPMLTVLTPFMECMA